LYARLITLICITFTCFLPTNAQSITIDMEGTGSQRTRVLQTKALERPPSELVWKSEKLFYFRGSELIRGQNGPFNLVVDAPTFQTFTTPIIAGNSIYLTYNDVSGYFFVVDKATGKNKLRLKFDQNAVSRPAVRDNMVYFGSAKGMVHAYDVATQQVKWQFQDKDHSFAYYPLLDRDLLFCYAFDRGVYAFAADTGEVKWLYKFKKFVHTLAVAGDRLIVLTETGRLIALDRETGAERWNVDAGRDAIGPQVLGDQIFLHYDGGEIRSYSAADGTLGWKSKDVPRSGSDAALHNGLVYYSGKEMDVVALDANTGAEKLRFKITRSCSAPLIAGELLYVRCADNKVHALSTTTLEQVWELKNGNKYPPSFVVENGVMYSLGPDGYMHAMR
jgi:eukaryotic-like serine/threonine-protein kinase